MEKRLCHAGTRLTHTEAGQEANPSPGLPVRPAGKPHGPKGHSYLQGHFLEVTPSPLDDVPKEEDGTVRMLRAVAAALQVGLIVGCQHICPACREGEKPPCLLLCLPTQPAPPRLQRQETSPTSFTHNRNGTLSPASSPREPLCRGSRTPTQNTRPGWTGTGPAEPGRKEGLSRADRQGAPGPLSFLKGKKRC